MNFIQLKSQRVVGLCIPGGLAGQLFGLAYASWISENLKVGCRIYFFDVGTSISKLVIGPILDSKAARSMGISIVRVRGTLEWNPGNKVTIVTMVAGWIRGTSPYRFIARLVKIATRANQNVFKLEQAQEESVIRSYHLKELSPGDSIAGYPTDYQIIEDSHDGLFRLMESSGLPNFLVDAGQEETISIHWRLGDYVNNPTHGALSWEFFRRCLLEMPKDLPVKLFTDSPDLARELILDCSEQRVIEVISGDIFGDLFGMTRSRYFIGSHSGISFLAALALHHSKTQSTIYLPSKWFLAKAENDKFRETTGVFGAANKISPCYLD